VYDDECFYSASGQQGRERQFDVSISLRLRRLR
jgi:hypothetical protein